MTFEEIVLSKDEIKLLMRLAKDGPALVETGNRAVFMRMERMELVEIFPVTNPVLLNETRRKSGEPVPKAAQITDNGRAYLAYLSAKNTDRRRDFRRDVLLLLIGAVIALISDRLPLFFDLLKRLSQSR